MSSRSEQRPNIVFAFADDWGRYASAYASANPGLNDHLSTPAFDRVAREGVLFSNAVVPAPSCTPCRSSVLSGRYFWNTGMGAILQGAKWDRSIPSYPLMLKQSGYHIGFTYKVWSPGTPADAPYGAEHSRYQQAGTDFNRFSHWVTEHANELGVEQAKSYLFEEVRKNFVSFLEDRPQSAPFCYWFGPTNTHRTWERGSGKALWGINPDTLEGTLPAFLPDVPEIREDVADYLGEATAFDGAVEVLLSELETRGELDNTLFVVSGDHGVPGLPRGKCNLYDIGLEVALAIRWPQRVQSGQKVDQLVNIMDLCPTFLEAAGLSPDEEMSARSLLGRITDGESAWRERPNEVVTGRERHVAGARDDYLPYPQRALRTREYLYIVNFAPDRWPMGDPRGLDDPSVDAPPYEELAWNTRVAYADLDASPTKAWMIHNRARHSVAPLYELGFGKRPEFELYDLRNDPDHMSNLAEDPEYTEIGAELHRRLFAILRKEGDPRVTEDPCRYELPPYASPA